MDRNLNLNINSDKIVKGISDINGRLKNLERQGTQTTKKIDKATKATSKAFDNLKRSVGGVITVMAAFSFAKTIGEFQSLRTSLGVVFQDIERGEQVFKDIQDIAGETPFSVQALTNSVIKLRAAGIEPTTAQLTLFSDVASVTTDKIGSLNAMTDLFSRTTSGGLGLEDLNRLADRGIPVFDILSQKMGLARLEVAKFGQSADGAAQILKVLTDELETRFGGASATAAKELQTSISNLGIAWDGFQDSLGTAGGLALATGLVVGFTTAVDFMAQNLDTVAIVMGGLSTLAIPALITGVKALTAAMVANPIGLLVVGITAAAAAIWHFRDDIYQALVKTFEVSIPNAVDSANIAFLKMKRGVGELMNGILSKINEFGNNLITSAPKWLQGLLGINGSTFSLGIDISEVNKQIDELEATITGRINNFVPPESIGKKITDTVGTGGLSTSGSLTGDKVGGAGGTGGAVADIKEDPFFANLVTKTEALQQSLLTEDELLRQTYDNRTLLAQNAFDFELISAQERDILLLASTQEFEAKKTAIARQGAQDRQQLMSMTLSSTASALGSMSQLLSSAGKKQSSASKVFAKASILTSTAVAIMKAWELPWPANIPAIAAAGLAGATQLAAIGKSGGIATNSPTNPVSSNPSLAATPIATPTQVTSQGETTINFLGDFNGVDPEFVTDLANQLAEQIENNDIRIISPTSRNGQDLLAAAG